jgi:hypothetical protein
MQKTILNLKAGRFLCVLLLLFFFSFEVNSQIVLNDQPVGLKPETFFIAAVTDERADKTTIGQLVVKEPGDKIILQATNLKAGAAVAIGKFLQDNLPQNHTLRPVVIGIRELSILETPQKETAQTGSRVDGRIRLSLSFGLQKDYGTEHLVNYKGSMQYTRYGAGSAAIEAYLRNILKGSLDYLDNWMKNNTPVNRKLAKSVKLSFTDYQEKPEGDTIYYAANRPLTWNDFQSRARPMGVFAAQVIPGIGYTQQAQMDKGMIEVTINMKTYLPKSASRANYSTRDAYALNHEQRHFDIAKIITEQFKKKLLAKPLTPDTFEAVINMQYFDSYRDLDAMQKAYDTETKHGIDRIAQAAWNSRIDKELNLYSQLP